MSSPRTRRPSAAIGDGSTPCAIQPRCCCAKCSAKPKPQPTSNRERLGSAGTCRIGAIIESSPAPCSRWNSSAWASEFHLEQGAGLDSMIAPILHVPAEPRRSLFEVGCGFGFALHFAQQQRGWIAQGVDPSPIAAEGRRVLGLDIRSSYLTEASDPGSIHDMILASEVIEHLPLAGPALRTMRARLSPHGVVALTTPDAACVSPAADLGILLPLLSPGQHLTLYSATGL